MELAIANARYDVFRGFFHAVFHGLYRRLPTNIEEGKPMTKYIVARHTVHNDARSGRYRGTYHGGNYAWRIPWLSPWLQGVEYPTESAMVHASYGVACLFMLGVVLNQTSTCFNIHSYIALMPFCVIRTQVFGISGPLSLQQETITIIIISLHTLLVVLVCSC